MLLDYITKNLSEYAGYIPTGKEIISEVFSSVYSKKNNNKFALHICRKCQIFYLNNQTQTTTPSDGFCSSLMGSFLFYSFVNDTVYKTI